MENKIEMIGNGIALVLGLAFLGDLFELWSFDPFDGWWVVFLYIPAICGFLTNGITAGGIMLSLTAIVFTVGMFTDINGHIWSAALILYLAYLGVRSIYRKWKMPDKGNSSKEAEMNHGV